MSKPPIYPKGYDADRTFHVDCIAEFCTCCQNRNLFRLHFNESTSNCNHRFTFIVLHANRCRYQACNQRRMSRHNTKFATATANDDHIGIS